MRERALKIGRCIMSCQTIEQLKTLEKFVLWFMYNPNRTVYSMGIGLDLEKIYLLKAKYLIYNQPPK